MDAIRVRLTSPTEVRALLAQMDFRPSRTLGQNFLIDGNILRIALDLADLRPADRVLEIGPGLGVLTGPLLEKAGGVVAIEKDDILYARLAREMGDHPRLRLLHADAMAVDLPGLLADGTNKVVANLPYSVGSRLLVEIAQAPARPERMVVTVQREVADRMAAGPGARDFGVLSLLLQLDYEIALRKRVSRSCFFPAPQIESALVELRRRPARIAGLTDERVYAELVKDCFAHRRKQLGSILRQPAALAAAGIEAARRPETLALPEWIALANAVAKRRPARS